MTSRYRPNEPTCPVPLELLSLLVRAPSARRRDLVLQMPEDDRADLGVYCARRGHMRDLGYAILKECSERSVQRVAGQSGLLLHQQALDANGGPVEIVSSRRPISLARLG
jgi:hypothetical protein